LSPENPIKKNLDYVAETDLKQHDRSALPDAQIDLSHYNEKYKIKTLPRSEFSPQLQSTESITV